MTVITVHVDLFGERKSHTVGRRAKLLNFFRGTGFLAQELVARNSENGKALVAVGLLQLFEAGVLRCQAALRGDVDEQHGGAGEVTEAEGCAIEAIDGIVIKAHGDTLPTTDVK